jgi:hypothetical protein
MIRCVRLMTGADGRSHVEYITIPIGTVQEATAIHFQESPAGFSSRLAHRTTRAVRDHAVGYARIHNS